MIDHHGRKWLRAAAMLGLTLVSLLRADGADASYDLSGSLKSCDVVWTTPGKDSQDSMPLGNGDIGLNVWTEADGDVLFYIGKTDAWAETQNSQLVKLGRVRLALSPNPFTNAADYQQALRLETGEIVVSGGGASLRIWVDANSPVVRVEMESPTPVQLTASLDPWRVEPQGKLSADIVVPNEPARILWYHRNPETGVQPPLAGRTFGALLQATGMTRNGLRELHQPAPATRQRLTVHALTRPTGSVEDWKTQLSNLADPARDTDWEKARGDHRAWWSEFWNRSHIVLSGGAEAQRVTQGYTLQRFVTACAGRGAYPIKFNGSIFVTDNPGRTSRPKGSTENVPDPMTADDRAWGGQYWFQNTRPMYWPRLSAGDFDMMQPLFRMYHDMLPLNAAKVREFYGHGGAYFRETAPFWGDLTKLSSEGPGSYTNDYFLPIIELGSMMLDYYEYTGDEAFARDTMLPTLVAGMTFYDEHFRRDDSSHLLLEPVNSIEMFWKVRNPLPDVAGFHFLLPRLLALPDRLVAGATRARFQRMLAELPPVPIGQKNGRRVILPYEGEQTAKPRNTEVPELYAVYPFRLYGVGKPDLDLALETFAQRSIKRTKCWHQDPVWAAYLGVSTEAKKDVTANLTNRDARLRFPAFWDAGHDYAPDEDNGGNGELALQRMLLQAEDRRIILLPAWPTGWDADFKLHAPLRTVVEGQVVGGKLVRLSVTPPERKKDVVLANGEPGL